MSFRIRRRIPIYPHWTPSGQLVRLRWAAWFQLFPSAMPILFPHLSLTTHILL
jgi:hypothetical protein